MILLSTNVVDAEAMLSACISDMEAFYENSQPFSKFLQNQGLDDLLRKTKLRLRERHAIVPHVSAECICFVSKHSSYFGYKR